MKIGIIGAGAWGTALAASSAMAKNIIIIWSYDSVAAQSINQNSINEYLPGIKLPGGIHGTINMQDLTDSDLLMIAVPAEFFRETVKKLKIIWQKQPIIICTKGMEKSTSKFMSEILLEEMGTDIRDSFGVLSGPNFAAEVAQNVPTGSTIAGSDKVIEMAKKALPNIYLQKSSDIIGTEICGIGKNAVALIAGFNAARAAGENEKALKLTLAWSEIKTFGVAFGAQCETFLNLCGIGDLFLSATSCKSRNYATGFNIANGSLPKEIGTVEGISALHGLLKRAKDKNIKMPILAEFEKILP